MILVRIEPYVENVKLESGQGLTQSAIDVNAWTLAVPTLHNRDIVIRYGIDGQEEYRYECLEVTRNKTFFGQSGSQKFKMKRLDKTDPCYQFSIV